MSPLSEFKTILSLVGVGRLESADSAADKLLSKLSDDPPSALIRFNLGAMYWTEFGDGVKARAHFLKAAQTLQGHLQHPQAKELYAHCCENLMLHALSYDDYDGWAQRLWKARPTEEILAQQHPRIMHLKATGQPWHRAALEIASDYYHVEETHVSGKPGCAASIMHLLLVYRQQMVLPRDVWKAVVIQFTALRLLVAAAASRAATRAGKPESTAEILTSKQEALKYLEEFEQRYPGDRRIAQTRDNLEESIARFQRGGSPQPGSTGRKPAGDKGDPPHWLKSPELIQAVKELGLDNIRLQMTDVSVLKQERQTTTFVWPGSLHLTFRTAEGSPAIPKDQLHNIGLALRCIVGLTLPLAASRSANLRVQIINELEYRVRLGDGVTLHVFNLFDGTDRCGGLEMRSDESPSEFHVFATHGQIPMEYIVKPELAAMRTRLMTALAYEFNAYRTVPIKLGK